MSKDKKKVCFIIPSYAGGGAEKVVMTIAKELQKYQGIEVLLIVLSPKGPLRGESECLEKIELNSSRARYASFALYSCLKKQDPDVVFGNLPQVNIVVYLISKLASPSWKLVQVVHKDLDEIKAQNNFIISYFLKKSLLAANRIITVSSGLKKSLISKLNISSEKVREIHNPVDIAKIQKRSREEVNKDIFTQEKPVLLGCGRLEEVKGFRYLIESLPKIKDEYPKAQIVLLGKGSLRNELEQEARELGVKDSVHFLGFVDNPYKYMRAADVFVLSSLSEGFGNVVVEALACDTPVIATDCPHGPKEILEEGKWGTIIPSKNPFAIAEAAINSLTKKSNIARLERANHFRPEAIVEKYKQLIDKICQDGSTD